MAEFGRIDVLFNNAMNVDFVSAGRDTDFLALDPEIFLTSMRTTVLGGLIAAKQALPHMLANGSGPIIFNSSIASLAGTVRPEEARVGKECVSTCRTSG